MHHAYHWAEHFEDRRETQVVRRTKFEKHPAQQSNKLLFILCSPRQTKATAKAWKCSSV